MFCDGDVSRHALPSALGLALYDQSAASPFRPWPLLGGFEHSTVGGPRTMPAAPPPRMSEHLRANSCPTGT